MNRWDKSLVSARKFPMTATPGAAAEGKPAPSTGWGTTLGGLFRTFTGWLASRNKAPAQPLPAVVKGPVWMTWAEKEVGFHEVGVNRGIEKYITLSKNGSLAELLGEPWLAGGSAPKRP